MTSEQKDIYFSVVIPNYNGEEFIARCLSSAILSARQSRFPYEIIVVDDGSTDRSCEIIRERFPQVRLLENRLNCGFAASINRGVRAAEGDIAVLLNNDIVVQPEFFYFLLKHFIEDKDNRIFGVSAKTLRWDTGAPDHLCMTASFNKGFLQLHWSDPKSPQPALFLIGGACAIRRHAFMALGGFSLALSPIYWEDYDLSYVAVKCGYQNIYEPRALAYHFGEATMTEFFSPQWVSDLKLRNELLFLWMNLSDWKLLAQHLFFFPFRLVKDCFNEKGFIFSKAVYKALRRLPEALYYRRLRRPHFKLSDSQVFQKFSSPDLSRA